MTAASAAPAAKLVTFTKRVRWAGPNPRVGNVLLSPGNRVAFVIRSVYVLHHAANSNRPRLKLILARVPSAQKPANAVCLPWSRTAPVARPDPAPAPARQPVRPASRIESAEQAAKLARDRRLAAEHASPLRAEESRWDDPEDQVRTRSPKQIKGYRRGDVIGRLWRKGTDITRDMMLGANAFRVNYDVARFGLTGGDPLADRVGASAPGPLSGPSAAASERVRAERDVRRLLETLGSTQGQMLLYVVIGNHGIADWVREHVPRSDGKSSADRERKSFGFLCAVLARTAEWYGFDESRDTRKELRS